MQERAIKAITDIFQCSPQQIQDIHPLKKGMTNDSFTFTLDGKKYIIRTPGVGTDKLINRQEEYAVYQTISAVNLCDDIVHIDPDSGYKISTFREDARECDPFNWDDVAACIERLKAFHSLKLTVPHTFCPFERIAFYESLWEGQPSCYADYEVTKQGVLAMKDYLDACAPTFWLTHIDAVPDNFLFINDDKEIWLIDWEYSAMQDQHLDIAMFIVYAMYDRAQADRLIDLYFSAGCSGDVRKKIYAYVAICGLLWSNWCEYKRQKGVELGVYALRQYEFAKAYTQIFKETT